MAETTEIALDDIELNEKAETAAKGPTTMEGRTEAKQPIKKKQGKGNKKDLDDLKQELEMVKNIFLILTNLVQNN